VVAVTGRESAAVAQDFGADAVGALELRDQQERRRAVLA
jgi:hypothetical protein